MNCIHWKVSGDGRDFCWQSITCSLPASCCSSKCPLNCCSLGMGEDTHTHQGTTWRRSQRSATGVRNQQGGKIIPLTLCLWKSSGRSNPMGNLMITRLVGLFNLRAKLPMTTACNVSLVLILVQKCSYKICLSVAEDKLGEVSLPVVFLSIFFLWRKEAV